MENFTLQDKIKKYSAAAAGVAAVAAGNAQVTYTDVNPDVVITPGGMVQQYNLDVDNNAVVDFVFAAGSTSGVTGTVNSGVPFTATYAYGLVATTTNAPANNAWMGYASGTSTSARVFPSALSAGAAIDANGGFYTGVGTLGLAGDVFFGNPYNLSVSLSDGDFLGSEGFVGLRFENSGNVHYGWARVEVSSDGMMTTIKDYAFEATAGAVITAGATGGQPIGIEDVSMNVQVIAVDGNLRVNLTDMDNAEISIVAIDGKTVLNDVMTSDVYNKNLSFLNTGIYIINVNTAQGMVSKKIYVK